MADTLEEGISRGRQSSLESPAESNPDDEKISLQTSWKSIFHFTTVYHVPLLLAALLITFTAAVARVIFALYLGKLFQVLSQFGTGAITGPQLRQQARDNTFVLLILGGVTWLLGSCFFFVWIIFAELQVRGAGRILFGKLLTRDLMWFDMRKDGVGSFLSHSQKYEFSVRICQVETNIEPCHKAITRIANRNCPAAWSFYITHYQDPSWHVIRINHFMESHSRDNGRCTSFLHRDIIHLLANVPHPQSTTIRTL